MKENSRKKSQLYAKLANLVEMDIESQVKREFYNVFGVEGRYNYKQNHMLNIETVEINSSCFDVKQLSCSNRVPVHNSKQERIN